MPSHDTKVWLITGSSRGLGRSFAEAVLAAGHRLVATARTPEQLADLVQQYGHRILPFALDVTNATAARDAVAAAVTTFGRLDVVVNNAGYANVAPIEDMTEEDFRAQIEANFFGVVNVTRAALPVMRRQRSGHIIQISSVGGRLGSPGLGAYQPAKWAVDGFSEVLTKEVAPLGIKVTVVEPGGFRTDWAGSSMTIAPIRDDYQETVGKMAEYRKNPDVMRGDPDKAAQVLLHIASLENPPRRLLLGASAVQFARAAAAQLAAEDEKWAALSLSAEVDDAITDHAVMDRLTATLTRRE
ncbi:MAG TPA: oxidoreductase [Gemmatimonadaceae bacterium]|nr:oxidoreductase [Gemmatimonadaceae bacterium]